MLNQDWRDPDDIPSEDPEDGPVETLLGGEQGPAFEGPRPVFQILGLVLLAIVIGIPLAGIAALGGTGHSGRVVPITFVALLVTWISWRWLSVLALVLGWFVWKGLIVTCL